MWGFTAVFCWGSCVGFCWRRFAPRVMTGLLSFDRSFRSREGEWFFSAGFPAMCVQAQPVCWRRLAPQAGAGPSFLDEKKGSKDSPRGEFRFSPPWNSLSTTKGAAFGNREKLPLWFLLTHRHGLRVKRVCKGSFGARKRYGKSLGDGHHLQTDKSKLLSDCPSASQRERSENARRRTKELNF